MKNEEGGMGNGEWGMGKGEGGRGKAGADGTVLNIMEQGFVHSPRRFFRKYFRNSRYGPGTGRGCRPVSTTTAGEDSTRAAPVAPAIFQTREFETASAKASATKIGPFGSVIISMGYKPENPHGKGIETRSCSLRRYALLPVNT